MRVDAVSVEAEEESLGLTSPPGREFGQAPPARGASAGSLLIREGAQDS